MRCPRCESTDVRYEGEVGAPGFGQAYRCGTCDAPLLKAMGILIDVDESDPEDLELQPWEVE